MLEGRISLDVDGVLADFLSRFYEEANRIRPGTFPATYRKVSWAFSADPNLSKSFINKVWRQIDEIEDFWTTLKPLGRSIQDVVRFIDANPRLDIFFVTSRRPTKGGSVACQTARWLSFFGAYNFRTQVIAAPSGEDKAGIYAALKITHSLDDCAANVPVGLENHRGILFRRPWSGDGTGNEKGLEYVNTVAEYFDIVRKDLEVT